MTMTMDLMVTTVTTTSAETTNEECVRSVSSHVFHNATPHHVCILHSQRIAETPSTVLSFTNLVICDMIIRARLARNDHQMI